MLTRITSFSDLALFLPRLGSLFQELDGRWEPDEDVHGFLDKVIDEFRAGSLVFAEPDDKGGIKYFFSVKPSDSTHAFCWLFYVNKNYRSETKLLREEFFDFLRSMGIKDLRWTTTRLTSSYHRWVEKFGGKKFAIIYQLDL